MLPLMLLGLVGWPVAKKALPTAATKKLFDLDEVLLSLGIEPMDKEEVRLDMARKLAEFGPDSKRSWVKGSISKYEQDKRNSPIPPVAVAKVELILKVLPQAQFVVHWIPDNDPYLQVWVGSCKAFFHQWE